ncbi:MULTISPECIES: hypothetical protein [unclassified Fictibacillus]|uniref:hypothetical protein n=1 Tax=unclassified Fictibacillus TaxID=2644029 RepID=UPI0006A77F32|nr:MULTISPECIES: hypothetical protein [unclassified Fictibacillus]MED2974714.1 hypothetical protein [Fictibacillus sp. B-59209]UZJ79095.1 hypothetical protein OKX00_00980 [Fictibacillus sp. KU28468]SFE95697.1 hypothetical protein SAMN05428981_1115 [Bacillus sp. OV194]
MSIEQKIENAVQYIKEKTSYEEEKIRLVLKEEGRYFEMQNADVDMDELIDHLARKTNLTELEVDTILEKELQYYEETEE